MSKIGQKAIEIPQGVVIEVRGQDVKIVSAGREFDFKLPKSLHLEKNDNKMVLSRLKENKYVKSLHGLYRQLIGNTIIGTQKPWQKRLEVVGTGFNVKLQGSDLVFKLGYSHPLIFKQREGVTYKVEGNNKVVVEGADKQLVGQIAYEIKLLRRPDVYKGKGIRYEGEVIKIKPGKKAKAVSSVGSA